ncbi:MAG: nuclear pore complex subunit [Bacteroidetes bacterium]|nr:MAG: nuclear pore complex subunit [Bacteroidota bacterium]
MENIIITGTPKTPEVAFLADSRTMKLSGRSIPENSIDFFAPLIQWADGLCSTAGFVEVNIRLEYFNTSSSKCLMDLLKRIEASAADACVNWYYEEEDEDMLEAGEDYDAIIDLPFKLIATETL